MNNKVIVFIKNNHNEYLLLRNNPADPAHGGDFWYTVTGGFDEGESEASEVAIRELKEETNLDALSIESLNWAFIYSDKQEQLYFEHAYLVLANDNQIILNEENIEFEWLPLDQFIDKITWYGKKEDIKTMLSEKKANIQFMYGPFLINMQNIDLKLINDLKTALANYQKVLKYLGVQLESPINMYLFNTKQELNQTLKNIHPTWFSGDIPSWVNGFVGDLGEYNIYMLNPNNKETEHDYESNLSVAFHEFIHVVANLIPVLNGKRPIILDEGITTFLNNQNEEWVQNTIIENFKQNNLPSIELLSTTDTDTFYNLNGYEYAYYFMAYLDEKYGSKKIVKYLGHPNLLISEINWEDFIIYLKQKLYNKIKR